MRRRVDCHAPIQGLRVAAGSPTNPELLSYHLRQVSVRRVAHAALWTLPSWAPEAGVIIVAAKALGVELSVSAAVAVTAFTTLFKEGKSLPAAEIWLLYEAGAHTRMGNSSRTLHSFARDPRRATDFPVATEFYESAKFLDALIPNAIRGRGEAENYTDAQKRQAINKGLLKIIYHSAKF